MKLLCNSHFWCIFATYKFQGHRSIGPGLEKKIFKAFTIYGPGGHVCHVTKTVQHFFVPLTPGGYI